MSDDAFAYATTTEMLISLDVEEAVKEAGILESTAYFEVFLERAGAAGDNGAAKAWALLANLCRVALAPSEPNEPFRPRWEPRAARAAELHQGLGRERPAHRAGSGARGGAPVLPHDRGAGRSHG